jgi:hypothetical protein
MDSSIVCGSVFVFGTGVSFGRRGGYGVHILLGNTEYVRLQYVLHSDFSMQNGI